MPNSQQQTIKIKKRFMQQNYYLTNGTRSGQSHSRSGTIDENLALRPNKFIIKTQQNSGQQNTGQAPVTIHKKMS